MHQGDWQLAAHAKSTTITATVNLQLSGSHSILNPCAADPFPPKSCSTHFVCFPCNSCPLVTSSASHTCHYRMWSCYSISGMFHPSIKQKHIGLTLKQKNGEGGKHNALKWMTESHNKRTHCPYEQSIPESTVLLLMTYTDLAVFHTDSIHVSNIVTKPKASLSHRTVTVFSNHHVTLSSLKHLSLWFLLRGSAKSTHEGFRHLPSLSSLSGMKLWARHKHLQSHYNHR
jgi:hypothetical protein